MRQIGRKKGRQLEVRRKHRDLGSDTHKLPLTTLLSQRKSCTNRDKDIN